ncbi:MAG: calcium/proton exchanger [Chitinophagaceae bacterium]|jgi:Ca2+:H+ antiporter|nr:calcium/proton exchanger [Chitinophagaceae bacterium]
MKKTHIPGWAWLLVFIPIAFLLEKMEAGHTYIFLTAALGIIPLAKLIGESTENLAHYTGDAIGGLLNATFGNLPELIICIIALKAGLHEMVLASIVGAILANLLLATGMAFFLGGIKHHTQEYNPASIRTYSTMMLIAIFSMIIPSAFGWRYGTEQAYIQQEANLNILLCIGLLLAYIGYLVFMMKTHPDYFKSVKSEYQNEEGETEHHEKPWSLTKSIGFLVGASVGAAFMSEILVGAAEGMGKELGMTTAFIGVFFVAIIGGAAESISAITMGIKNKLDLTMGIAVGSSIQIALFIVPVLVLASFFIGPEPMFINFNRAESTSALMAVLLTAVVAGDGKSNWYKGVQMITLYFLIALFFYFAPQIG